jgi:glycosyltransferase involved in cell wall biosynthesis
MPHPSSSLIISTYNRPDALKLCLESVTRQVKLPEEVIIADDGSNEETASLVEWYQSRFPVPLHHIWQPDEGYQLAKIRNRAFAAAKGDYIIQIDGDLILHPRFVQDHLMICRKNQFISGTRALLQEPETEAIISSATLPEKTDHSRLDKKYNAVYNRLLSYLVYTFSHSPKSVYYVLGCNMAFWKEDLLKVNGYNEAFTGWGKEDNDIAIRLVNVGVKLRFLKFGGIVYHLYHPEAPRSKYVINEELFRESIQKKTGFVAQGMSQYF